MICGLDGDGTGGETESYRNYLWHESESAWALSHFVVPASRLPEFEAAQSKVFLRRTWRLSCLIGNNLHDDLLQIDDFNRRNGSNRAVVDSIEIKLGTDENSQFLSQAPTGYLTVYFEVSLDSSREQLSAIQKMGARAKVRTGGVTPDTIPPTDRVAGFLARSAGTRVAFKATAGLHHPIRCVRPLTYEPDALQARMHGFVNVFVAAGRSARQWDGLRRHTGFSRLSFGINLERNQENRTPNGRTAQLSRKWR